MVSGFWSVEQCNAACGNGTQRRDIICVKKTGSDFSVSAASECSHLEKPSPVQPCELQPCKPQWFTTEWSTVRTTSSVHESVLQIFPFSAVTDFSSVSVQCSRSCGEGKQTREVRCLTADKQHSTACDLDSEPAHERSCNTIPCSPFEGVCESIFAFCMMRQIITTLSISICFFVDENCKDRRHNCVTVVQARLCVYSYYKTACCASCTQSAQRAKRH